MDSETGERILTCYLLPQQHTDDQEGREGVWWGMGGDRGPGDMTVDDSVGIRAESSTVMSPGLGVLTLWIWSSLFGKVSTSIFSVLF